MILNCVSLKYAFWSDFMHIWHCASALKSGYCRLITVIRRRFVLKAFRYVPVFVEPSKTLTCHLYWKFLFVNAIVNKECWNMF